MLLRKQRNRHTRLTWIYRALDAFRLAARFFRRHPLTSDGDVTHRPFFIIGSGRSGTTLLRAMLVAHGALAIPPESYVLGTSIREYYRFSFLSWHMVSRLVISRFECHPQFSKWDLNLQPLYQQALSLPPQKRTLAAVLDLLYRYYMTEKQPGAWRWGDKTPLNTLYLNEINRVFPDAQYIHIIRDGRDVAASYLQAGLYSDLSVAAQRWLRSVQAARRLRAMVGFNQYIEVKYESLVTQPEAEMERVCHFLDVEYRACTLDFWQSADQLGDTLAPHHANLQNPISDSSVGRWHSFFSIEEQNQLHRDLGPQLLELGYQQGKSHHEPT